MRRRFFSFLVEAVACFLALGPTAVQAQASYPNKPIRLVVPYGTGGPSDIIARAVADEMAKSLGQSVLVDNKPGAGSMLGTEVVVRSPADGYTLLLADLPLTIVPHVLRSAAKYDPVRDLEPVALIGGSTLGLYVNAAVPAQTLGEFVALAKRSKDGVRLASGGNGTLTHLLAEVFSQAAGFRMTHVPYQGVGPALPDLIAGRVDGMFTGYAATAPFLADKKLRPLAIAASARATQLPGVQTFAEAGYPAVSVNYWVGIAAPAQLPKAVGDAVRQALEKSLHAPAVKERFRSLFITPARDLSRESMRSLIEADYARWGAVVRERNISAN